MNRDLAGDKSSNSKFRRDFSSWEGDELKAIAGRKLLRRLDYFLLKRVPKKKH